ncbi:MAG: hypothetical protein LUP97_06275 [Methanoregula sp.]|nr:hypothetical protein [Methanoregula sp.]
MTTAPGNDKKEAFRLFEEGRYPESLLLCNAILEAEKDSSIEVLAATNLFSLGRLEDAEVFFRDLGRKMPDSSYVHSYLGKVLEARGDEGAIAEYATAVHLDPENQDALRSYADFLLSGRDYRGALPVLRKLVQLARRPGDVKKLMRAQVELGEAGEALASYADFGGDESRGHEYIDALTWAGKFSEAAGTAEEIWRETEDPRVLRKYLTALAQYDMPASLKAYESHLQGEADEEVLFDYILLKKASGKIEEALPLIRKLILRSRTRDPRFRLMECDLLSLRNEPGDGEKALAAYESLIRDELVTKNDLPMLRQILSWYRQCLFANVPPDEAIRRFLRNVSEDPNVASLIETGRLYDQAGNEAEARGWYYRAYRADFLTGGIEYAGFLYNHGEERESEKVMLYLLANARKVSDLTSVAAEIVTGKRKMYRMKRLMEALLERLEERRSMLGSEGLELVTIACFIAATNALEEADFRACKYYCLAGLDVMPAQTRMIKPEDYLALIQRCKERTIADRPIMKRDDPKRHATAGPPQKEIHDRLGLSEQEEKIVAFLRSHRKATEMDLRKLLGTRRVVGIVNRIRQKAAGQGVRLFEKRGVGGEGEVYEYTGT